MDETQVTPATTGEEVETPQAPVEQPQEPNEVGSRPPAEDVSAQLAAEQKARRELTARAKAAEEEVRRLKKASETPQSDTTRLEVDSFIDISASLEGLDQREKEFLAEQHKMSGKSLREIRQSEDYALWQSAYRAKVDKEKALKPNAEQPDAERPKSFHDKLKGASTPEERNAILKEMGYFRNERDPADEKARRKTLVP